MLEVVSWINLDKMIEEDNLVIIKKNFLMIKRSRIMIRRENMQII